MSTPHRQKRRMSVDDATAALLNHVHNTIQSLSTLWDEVAMDRETREKRTQAAYQLFYNTMNEIVANEHEMINNVRDFIERELPEVQSTLNELGLSPFDVSKFAPNSIVLFKALKAEKDELTEKKKVAMARQLKEYDKLVEVCGSLSEPVPQHESIKEKIARRSLVDQIVKERIMFESEIQKRRAELHKLQDLANRRNTIVKNITLQSVERELLCMDFDAPDFVLSTSLINQFKSLIEKFDAEYEKWRENVEFQYAEVYVELSSLAEKCYAPDVITLYPSMIDLDVHEPELINSLRDDVEKLKARYETGKNLFDCFQNWFVAFGKLAEIDAELNTDRARQNRGGYLAKLLEKQKRFKRDADKSLRDLELECEKNKEVTIEGRSPHEQALWLIQLREQEKENEKAMKKFAKAKLLQTEARFGTSVIGSPTKSVISASTPRKRAIRTPTSAKSAKTPKYGNRADMFMSNF